ncbi:MAG: ankyrin repeat domain-containing protein [Desulfomonile tiedjei]|nr:ankyrin repeat domain-containing protein [Desulfomonile tiedjei]
MLRDAVLPCSDPGGVAMKATIPSKIRSLLGYALILSFVFSALSSTCSAAPEPAPPANLKLQTGELHALVVGVARYQDAKIPTLGLADKDAKAFGEFLESQKKVFKAIKVKLLMNEQATKAAVEKHLYYTLHKTGKQDSVVLFFSGHGAYDPLRPKDFLFLTYDAEPDYLGATAVKMSGLEFLKGIEAERVLIIADACYAGGFSKMKPKGLAPAVDRFLKEVRSSSGTAIITSGNEGELSWEVPNLRNSIFTHTLIEGLNGKADVDRDGVVTLTEAYQYAYNLTKEGTEGRQHPQLEGKISSPFPLSYVGPPVPRSEVIQELLAKAKTSDPGEMERLLTLGADVNTRNDENDTPLIVAARSGKAELVKLFLEKGADLEAKNHARFTALAEAARNGHTDSVKLLLAAGAKVNSKTADGSTPLSLASGQGHDEVVRLLLSHHADIKSRTSAGKTALILAASQGRLKVVTLLAERGADINASDLEGATPWTEAARNGHASVVKFLMQKGAEITARKKTFLDNQLILAALANDVPRTGELVGLGANVNAQTESGDTPLALAAGLGHLKLIETLVEKGAEVNLRTRGETTPLLLASQSGRKEVAELLLARGAYVDAIDKDGNTALLLAARHGRPDMVKLLLNAKADVGHRNELQSTPLLLAAESGNVAVVRSLLTARPDVNARNVDGDTALIAAAARGHVDIVKVLCDSHADANARNKKKGTALIAAAREGHAAVVKVLLARGADPGIQDWEGKTARTVAAELGRTEVSEALTSKGSGASKAQ